ncbi:MAG: hypothetical protein D9C04_07190 [Nitrosopumilus sp. B06]|nr:MAG: hypothetical protein EB828_06530 [Nitrosopumilus sp. D6]RNJ78478.1 MAG: hypothetical protein D9C04_07190 [Nitrosopumilus sp. B06]
MTDITQSAIQNIITVLGNNSKKLATRSQQKHQAKHILTDEMPFRIISRQEYTWICIRGDSTMLVATRSRVWRKSGLNVMDQLPDVLGGL